nr:unnamed protein product [Callosobruchus analis]
MSSRSKRMVDLAFQMEKHTGERAEHKKIRIQKREVNSKPQCRKEADQNRRMRTLRVSRVAQNKFQHFTLKNRSTNQEATNSLSFEPENYVSEKELDESLK